MAVCPNNAAQLAAYSLPRLREQLSRGPKPPNPSGPSPTWNFGRCKMKPMDTTQQKQLVQNYIEAYNRFDVDGMLRHLHEEVMFRNVSNGEVNLILIGKERFRKQATQALQYFSQREQRVTDWQVADSLVEVLLDYTAIAAVDFPNGLKAGDTLQLQGKSVFGFADNQIISIDDIS